MKYALALFSLFATVSTHAGETRPRPLLAYLEGKVDEESVLGVLEVIEEANESNNRVILEINTNGGSVNEGFVLAKAIERARNPVTCVVDGHAFSMGSYIFEACQRRVMTKRSVLMIHQVGVQISGHEEDFLDAATMVAVISRSLFEHYAYHIPGLSVSEMVTKTAGGRCIWIDWREAQRLLAVDVVVNTVEEVK